MDNNVEQRYAKLMKLASEKIAKLEAELTAIKAQDKSEPIAITGMGCRFPARVSNLEAYWHLLQEGVDGITEVPNNRWNKSEYYDQDPEKPGKMYVRHGGFVDRLEEFDPSFFGISAKEATSLDPQQRLLLEVVWEALENAAQNPQELNETQTGVFIGICSNDYAQYLMNQGVEKIDAYFGSGNAHSTASGRLSYFLGLRGPSFSVDTACSSSLVSVHLACSSLRNRECNLAIAGGVNRLFSPETSITFSKARMLSADGRCKTFDASADGFVRSEGCGVIILKRLSDALANGDRIFSVIRGTAINQDGHTSGLTVPNGPSQQSVIRQALENGGVDASDVSYIEAHGTGTSLGDPIEMGALKAVFAKTHSPEKPLIVGSVKTNIGHLEAAAGIAGLIKVVLQINQQKIAPNLHFKKPNPYIDWSNLPIIVPTELTPWQSNGKPRVAGVSSFGFSGTNAHVILEEGVRSQESGVRIQESGVRNQESGIRRQEAEVNQKSKIENLKSYLLPLSAKNPSALKGLVKQYIDTLERKPELNIRDICYTASIGRSHFDYRLGIVATSTEELKQKLQDLDEKELFPEPIISQQDREIVFKSLKECYLSGLKINWSAAFKDDSCQKILLPTYPFQRQRYWVEDCSEPKYLKQKNNLTEHISEHIVKTKLNSIESNEIAKFMEELEKSNVEDRTNLLINYLQNKTSQILELPVSETLLPHQSFADLGFDSLMVFDLKNKIYQELKLDLSLKKLAEGSTIEQLASILIEQLALKNILISSPSTPHENSNLETFKL
jgi:acyl transferase domain-containing protein/acyl carrier protein